MVNLRFGGPNGLTQGFNWVFLLELIVVVIVVVFLLFFFNRVFGSFVSYIIRAFTWHRYKAYIHVEAIQVSFLAGRILFKNFRYQSRNQSIYVLKGHITWRYWLRRVRVRENSNVKEGVNIKLPCRIILELEGVEWFIYNRTPAYDAIVTAAEGRNVDGLNHINGGLGRSETERSSADRSGNASLKQRDSDSSMPMNRTAQRETDEPSSFLHMLPIQVICKKGAIILGNTNTPSIIVAQFVQADLSIDAAESRSKFDLYKMIYNCHFTRPTIQIKMNIDYKESLLARASHVVEQAEAKVPSRAMPSMWRTLRDLIPFFQESTESLPRPRTAESGSSGKEEKPWSGLPRYSTFLEDDAEGIDQADADPNLQQEDVTEYAKVTTILDAAELRLSFYYDEPGRVPSLQKQLPSDEAHLGNGDLSPEWGMDIEVAGATISYGPWADRQRGILQEMFFPGTYEDSTAGTRLNVGDRRVYAYFKVLIEFKDGVTFKIPTKEKSKDWKYSTQYLRSSIDQRVTTRSFAWIELKAAAESTITYHMGLSPRQDGWTNFLNLELKRIRVTTSVNYGILTEADGVRVQCDLSNPLKWNALHNWAFNVTVFKPSIFLLRDHITLLSDCGADWTSAPTDYATWIPYNYSVNVSLVDFRLLLNVNDGNIISSPSELNENSYIAFRGAKMSAKAIIPSDKISPVEHCVQFEVQCPAMTMAVHAPLWNTLSILLSEEDIGHLHKLELVGSYTYPSDVSRNNIETLDMQVSASYVSVVFYGFLLRYLFNVRNNYFGDHTQFVTLEEYQKEAKLPGKDILHATSKRPPVSNVLDVIIAVQVAKGAMILPSRLYEVSEGIRMHFDMLQADVRFMDYYMDLQVDISPVSCFHHLKEPMDEIFEELGDKFPQAFIDGINVHAHRLLGKPPSNPAYICNWDFDIGMITGEAKIPFLKAIKSAMDSFVYNLQDVENALPEISPPDRDITFLRLNAAGASLTLPVDTEEIRVQIGPTTLGADDRTSLLRSSKATVSIQSMAVQVLHEGKLVASFDTALRMTILGRRQDLLDHGPKQARHVQDNDAPSRRAWFLYSKKKGHVQDDLDTFEIDLPPLAPERVASIHSRTYAPKSTVFKGENHAQGIHFAASFLAPDYKSLGRSVGCPTRPSTPAFHEETPTQHSSYNELVSTHVDNLPKAQQTLILEVSADTTILITPGVIHSAKVLFQAFETTDPVASLDAFQQETVSELLAVKRDRSNVIFAEMIIPKIRICLQGDDGLGLLFDIVDLAPQFRSVHFKNPGVQSQAKESQESSISIIASLRRADAIVYRHDSETLSIPDIPSAQRKDLAHVSVKKLAVKVRQGQKVVGSVSLGDLECSINAHEFGALSTSANRWLDSVSDLSETIESISRQRHFKSRNLLAALVLAGDKHGIINDPPFLTRPSHVLRISKNLLRVDDSWKISARIRHIGRSLPPDALDEIRQQFNMSHACTLDKMDPVLQILSRWRSWELSNIHESYFYKWLSGAPDEKIKEATRTSIEGLVIFENVVAFLNVGDGNENSMNIRNAVLSCIEHPEQSPSPNRPIVMGVDVSCESFAVKAGTDGLDFLKMLKDAQGRECVPVAEPDQPNTVDTSSELAMEYRGTVLISQVNVSAQAAEISLAISACGLRVSGFSQLHLNELNSPSFCLSFEQFGVAIFTEPQSQEIAAHINLEHFSAQMLSTQEKPGVAASLGLFAIRLTQPIPWLLTKGFKTLDLIKRRFDLTPENLESPSSTFQKPDVPTITFRLHRATIEGWLVPNSLLVNVDSGGLQLVLGELADSRQWGFFDVPPATISLHRVSPDSTKLAEIITPFLAVKARLHWSGGLCGLDSEVQVGILQLSMTSLATLFRAVASEEVVTHLTECQNAIDTAQPQTLESEPIVESRKSNQAPPPISYRVHSMWETVEITADTPEAKVIFACSDIRMSLSNRSGKAHLPQRVLFMVGCRSTSLSMFAADDLDDKIIVADMQWEIGNSMISGPDGRTLYRLYLISDAFTITLSPRSISQVLRALSHVAKEVDKLQIKEALKDLDVASKRPKSRDSQVSTHDQDVAPTNQVEVNDADPFEALANIDAVRVSFSNVKFKWIANDRFNGAEGFTFKCKTVDASVLNRATQGRFVVHDGEVELNCRRTKISNNYARLPKLDFNVVRQAESDGWQLQLDARGDTVQVNFTPACIETGHAVLQSISAAAAALRVDFTSDHSSSSVKPLSAQSLLQQTKRLKSVITSINFSGAKINAQYDEGHKATAYMSKYRVQGDGCNVGSMHIPGLALRSRFSRKPRHVFHAEICILESTNILPPQIKPFIHDILRRVERVMSRHGGVPNEPTSPATSESSPRSATILGDLKFSVGLRVQSQELTLTCDPFAKVDAKVGVNEIYATLISCKTSNHDQTFAMTVTMTGAHISLQHHYSGIASAMVKLNDLNLSMFNNDQIRSSEPGISAILKSSALEISLNARQGQDFLIFNTLWLEGPPPDPVEEMRRKRLSNPISMQQLHKVTTSPPSFPINVTVLLDKIKFAVDLGQSIGTSDLELNGLRISNRKCSDYHHCIFVNIDSAAAESKGRFSGYMNANKFMVQTSIYFPSTVEQTITTPLVQIDVKLGYVEFRTSFEYHIFLIGDSSGLRFTIYNRRISRDDKYLSDRLEFIGDAELVQLYATAEGPALVLSLYKAVIQLEHEKEEARDKELAAFNEVDSYLSVPVETQSQPHRLSEDLSLWQNTISASRLDIEMSIKFAKINIGIFKAALNDSPVFRVNVADIRALFSQSMNGALENRLDLSLGTLGIALSPLKRMSGKELSEMKVDKWIKHVSTMRGGVILAVPETEGSMWTRQEEHSDVIKHIFKSRLDGKVDIGWNYGSVMYVQELWKTFELKLKQGEESRVTHLTKAEEKEIADKVEAETFRHENSVEPGVQPDLSTSEIGNRTFTYYAVEPAIIETPQLRQMGEATPPMEWIGVNRMRLPAFTHQAFIVPLQKASRRVEYLYDLTLQSRGT